jgi:YHS domain-containing protein
MVAAPSPSPAPRTGDFIVTRGGKTYVFDSAEDARAFVNEPLTDEEHERALKALELLDNVHQSILRRTRGRGISPDDIEEAIQVAKEH